MELLPSYGWSYYPAILPRILAAKIGEALEWNYERVFRCDECCNSSCSLVGLDSISMWWFFQLTGSSLFHYPPACLMLLSLWLSTGIYCWWSAPLRSADCSRDDLLIEPEVHTQGSEGCELHVSDDTVDKYILINCFLWHGNNPDCIHHCGLYDRDSTLYLMYSLPWNFLKNSSKFPEELLKNFVTIYTTISFHRSTRL